MLGGFVRPRLAFGLLSGLFSVFLLVLVFKVVQSGHPPANVAFPLLALLRLGVVLITLLALTLAIRAL
eukprot:scaffold217674_cov28-Tisochrysis_lutea.AAC.1